MEKYYVYAYLREDRYSPYYIGKGSGFRDTNKRKLGLAQRPPDRDRIVRIKENLTEQEALSLEVELIRFWVKKDSGGVLINKTDGGEGTSGSKRSKASREKTSMSMKGKPAWNKGIKITDERILNNYKNYKNYKRRKGGKCGKKCDPFILEGITYFSQKECAKLYGVSDRSIRFWIKRNEVPKHRRLHS